MFYFQLRVECTYNGEARKRIRPTIQNSFRMEITENDVKNNNKRAFASVYPIALFSNATYSLTADNGSKSVFSKQLSLDGNYEFHIEQDAVTPTEKKPYTLVNLPLYLTGRIGEYV